MPDVTSPFAFMYPEDTDLVRDGAQDIENLATGVNDYLAGGYLYQQTIYYTSSGTFVKADYAGLRAIRVRLVGAGGGGAGAGTTGSGQVSGGGGGGGGGYSEKFITDIAGLDVSETVTRGSGGAGGTGNVSGTAGGNSSAFGMTGNGGGGGANGASTVPAAALGGGGTGGDASGGDYNAGGGGGTAFWAQATDRLYPGRGGDTAIALNRQPQIIAATSGAGGTPPGQSFGCGGVSAQNIPNDGTARTGGSGQNGLVIVDVFV
jgi:hypothetical protein